MVLLRHGALVQSKGFRRYQALGNPLAIVERLSAWASDELIYLDISPGPEDDPAGHAAPGMDETLAILSQVARRAFMPLTSGGRIRTLADAAARIERGADKVTLNSAALAEPDFVTRCARTLGAQCVVLSIDARRDPVGGWSVVAAGGRRATGRDPAAWAREGQERGAGEILIQSIDNDGRRCGYDLELIGAVCAAVSIPVIALGGVGTWAHLADGLRAGADAVAAANIFNHTEHSVLEARRSLHRAGWDVRPPRLAAVGALT